MSTSFYLGRDDGEAKNAQMLLGGAYDKAKVDGELITVEMVDPHDLRLASGQTNVVNVTAIEVVLDNGNQTSEAYGDKGVGVPVLMDTGVASSKLHITYHQQTPSRARVRLDTMLLYEFPITIVLSPASATLLYAS